MQQRSAEQLIDRGSRSSRANEWKVPKTQNTGPSLEPDLLMATTRLWDVTLRALGLEYLCALGNIALRRFSEG